MEVDLDHVGDEGDESPQEPGHAVWCGLPTEGVAEVGDEADQVDGSTDVDEGTGEHRGSLS